jgi:uncharacterized paraquat-inducible protein A
MESTNQEQNHSSAPYQIICPHCGQSMDVPKTMPESPMICPSCNQTISDDYEISYRPSKKSKTFRIVAWSMLIIFGLLILLAAAAALHIFTQ